MTTPKRLTARDFASALALIQRSFAYMDGRVDPPSSMHRLTSDDLAHAWEVWGIGTPLCACMVLTPKQNALYVGKLAVDEPARGRGLARRLITLAAQRARDLGLPDLELQTRVELIENHATFAAMGFVKTGETAHPGYTNPTSITMRKPV